MSGMSGFNGYSLQYRLSASTTPGVEYQYIRLNNADPTLATHIYISATDQDGTSVYAFLTSFNQNSFVILSARDEANRRHIYRIDGVTGDGSTFADYTVTYMGGLGAFGSDWMIQLQFGAAGLSGFSGYSGWSGWSGKSGWSGISGWSGWSGRSGWSGISGWSGWSGKSGWSGISGWSGWSGMAGPSLLSVMTVDSDKDWQQKSITNMDTLGVNEVTASIYNGMVASDVLKSWTNWETYSDMTTFDSWLQVYTKPAIGYVTSNGFLAIGYSGFSGVSANANLLVNGSADASSGFKVGGTEVIASNRVVKPVQAVFQDTITGADYTGGGRITRGDRATLGGIVFQLGNTASKLEVIDKGWTKVVASVDNSGNTIVEGYMKHHQNAMFRVSRESTSYTHYASSGFYNVQFNAIGYSYHTNCVTTGGVFTAPVSGMYLFVGQVDVEIASGYEISINLVVNGVAVNNCKHKGDQYNMIQVVGMAWMTAGETAYMHMAVAANATVWPGTATNFTAWLLSGG